MAEVKKGCDRSAKIDRAKLDKDKRSIELAFASETPVERWGENEVLSLDRGDYDFNRIASGTHPLLLGHDESDPNSQIGVVESARVDSDKIARATVRFGNSPLASQIFQDVQDGIRQLVSVGYDRTGIVSSKKASDGMVTTRYRWMPTHIAIVPVPADTKAGIGRDSAVDSAKTLDIADIAKNLTAQDKMKLRTLLLDPAVTETAAGGGGAAAAVVDEGKIRTNVQTLERSRVKEITKVATELEKDHPHCAAKIREITNEAISGDSTLGDYQIRAMREVLGAKPAKPVLMADLGMSDEEQRSYSILRGIQSCIKRSTNIPDGLEGDVHTAMEKLSLPGQREGFMVPANAPVRCRPSRRQSRDLQVSVFGQGGATVPTNLVTPVIELLRNRMVTEKLGVIVMGGLTANVAIPRQTGAATAYSLPESTTLTKSTQALDQILLAPHRVGAYNDYTKQLLLQSSIDVENFIRDDLMKVIALKWDSLIIYGQGAGSEPQGIANTPGIGAVLFGGSATFAKLVAFETALAVLNADDGAMAYATTPAVRGVLKSAAKLLTGATTVAAQPLWENGGAPGEGMVNGYRAIASNQVQNNQVIFGNWSDVIHGLYGGYDVVVNPYSRDTDAAVRITINTFGDVAVRHAASFAVSSDAGNQ